MEWFDKDITIGISLATKGVSCIFRKRNETEKSVFDWGNDIIKLADVSSGADWIIWVAFVIFLVISIMLLSGHGSWFISGYNIAPKEEKAKYDEKK